MPIGKYPHKPHTQEFKDKMSKLFKGRKMSDEQKKKLSIALRGNKNGVGKKPTKEVVERIRLLNLGKHLSNETKLKISQSIKGKRKITDKWRKAMEKLKGSGNPNWQGGKTPFIQKLRNSKEYQIWRKSVFERDNYTCIWCGDNRGHNLNADHIKPFALFPELRFAIDNGRTLCESCHKTTFTYGAKLNKQMYAS